jgi:hypothetical protein
MPHIHGLNISNKTATGCTINCVSDSAGDDITFSVRTSGPYTVLEQDVIFNGVGAVFTGKVQSQDGANSIIATGLPADVPWYIGAIQTTPDGAVYAPLNAVIEPFTFLRDTPGTAQSNTGMTAMVPINTPAFPGNEWAAGSFLPTSVTQGVQLEPPAVNYLRESRVYNNPDVWVNSGDGVTTGMRLGNASESVENDKSNPNVTWVSMQAIMQTATLSQSVVAPVGPKVFSAWMTTGSGGAGEGDPTLVEFSFDGGATWTESFVPSIGAWQRYTFPVPAAADPELVIRLSQTTVAQSGFIFIADPQIEMGEYPSSVILTDASTASRGVTLCYWDNTLPVNDDYTVHFEFSLPNPLASYADGSTLAALVVNRNDASVEFVLSGSNVKAVVRATGGDVELVSAAVVTEGQLCKVSFRSDSSTGKKLWVDADTQQDPSTATTANFISLNLGTASQTAPVVTAINVKNVRFICSSLSDAIIDGWH